MTLLLRVCFRHFVQRPYEYIAFIDEAGDPGLTKVRPKHPNGASEWLTMGAVVILAQHETKVVDFVRDVRNAIGETQGPDLHFRSLSDKKKLTVATRLAERNLSGFALLSHKPNMQGHRNYRAEAFPASPRGWFYNWCVRLLLERVTDYVLRDSLARFEEPRAVKLVFSRRGGTKYPWLKQYIEYLCHQSADRSLYKPKRDIKHEVVDTRLLDVVWAKGSAGCQLADVVTSAFHCAADASGPRWNVEPAKALKPIMPTEGGFWHDYSVALQPSFFTTTRLTPEQCKIFEAYNYPPFGR